MVEIEERLCEFEERQKQIDKLRKDLIAHLIKLYLANQKNPIIFEKSFYKFLAVEEKILSPGTAYGVQLQEHLFTICEAVLRKLYPEICNIKKEKILRPLNREDILRPRKREDILFYNTKLPSPLPQVVLEVKSFIEGGTSSQSIKHLEDERAAITGMGVKEYFVFASSNHGDKTFESWEKHKGWIFLRCKRKKNSLDEPIWEIENNYYPFHNMMGEIIKVFK